MSISWVTESTSEMNSFCKSLLVSGSAAKGETVKSLRGLTTLCARKGAAAWSLIVSSPLPPVQSVALILPGLYWNSVTSIMWKTRSGAILSPATFQKPTGRWPRRLPKFTGSAELPYSPTLPVSPKIWPHLEQLLTSFNCLALMALRFITIWGGHMKLNF